MKQDKQDRRSLRTRRLVSSAMMELLLEKRFDAITVQDLLDRAGVGRSTFYAHYFDKDDVLASIAEQMLETFRQQVTQQDADDAGKAVHARNAGQRIVPSLALFRHVQEQYPQFRALLRGHAEEVLWETGQVLLSRNIEQALLAARPERLHTSPLSVPVNVAAQYLAGAFLTLFKWWLEAEMPYPPEEMDRIFRRLALPGVMATLEDVGDE